MRAGRLLIRPLRDIGRQRQPHDHQRLLAVALDDQDVALVDPVVELAEAVGSGLALAPQHPGVAKRKLKVMADSVSAADLPGADQRGYRQFNPNALPVRAEAAHDTGTRSV